MNICITETKQTLLHDAFFSFQLQRKPVYLNLIYSTWRVVSSHETPLQALTIAITEQRFPNESTSIADRDDCFHYPPQKKVNKNKRMKMLIDI